MKFNILQRQLKVYYMNKYLGVAVAECFFTELSVVPDCFLVKITKEVHWPSWQGKGQKELPEELRTEEFFSYMPYMWDAEYTQWKYKYIDSYEVE